MSTTSSETTVYFITGCNRGIGLGLIEKLAQRSNVVVYAGVRSPSEATKLNELASEHSNKIIVVKVEATSVQDFQNVCDKIAAEQGRIDVAWAHAGIGKNMATITECSIDNMQEHFDVNTIGPLKMFQTVAPLLYKSKNPKFAATSSIAGTLAAQSALSHIRLAPYAVSKIACNMVLRRIYVENTDRKLTVLGIHPGTVATDMTAYVKESMKTQGAGEFDIKMISMEESATGCLKLIDDATFESSQGQMFDVETGNPITA